MWLLLTLPSPPLPPVHVEVQFTLTETYPDTPPAMEVIAQSGLTDEQAQELVEKLQEQVRM